VTPVLKRPPPGVRYASGMSFLSGRSVYDRRRVMEAAAKASAKRRRKRAIRLYRSVLAREPENEEIHGKLAPLLGATKRRFDAWISYAIWGEKLERDDVLDRAAATYREAAGYLPGEIEVWLRLAAVERKRGRPGEAAAVLRKGRRSFRGASQRAQAIHLLRAAREFEPWHPASALDLAKLLAKTDQREEARMLLQGLSERCSGRELVRVRAAMWRLDRTVANLARWLHAASTRGRGAAPAPRPVRSR
jgi:tetratricopeptide (TPR) repeat protein